MKKYNALIKKLSENMTTGSVLGGGQTHPSQPGQPFEYAGKDTRIPSILGSKKKKPAKIIRRTFPKGL